MIFQRAVQRELAQTALAVFVALFAILTTTQLIRLLSQAAGGKIVPEAVLALLGFGALGYLPVLMSLTVFVAVLLTLSRAYRDSEMVVWFSSGLSLRDWVWPVLRFAGPIVITIAALSLFLAPWALNKSAQFRDRIEQRDDMSRITPGAFKESASGERVFFVEGVGGNDNNSVVRNIFASSMQHGRLGVMMAESGRSEVAPNGDAFIVMEHGRRYEGTPGTAEYRVMTFERYGVRTEVKETRFSEASPKSMSTPELLQAGAPPFMGEIAWRIGVPLSALVLSLLAIPLSFVNPRAGRTNNLIFAILTFMFYSNLLSLTQAWIAKGKIPFELGVWAVHVMMFVLLLLMFWRRLSLFSFGRLWR